MTMEPGTQEKPQVIQAEVTGDSQPGAEKASPPVSPEPDWAKANGRLQTRIAQLEEELAGTRGSVRKQAELEALIVNLNAQVEAMNEHLTNPDSTLETFTTKTSAIKQRGAQAVALSRIEQIARGWMTSLAEDMNEVGVAGDDPRFAEAAQLWTRATETKDLALFDAARDKAQKVIKAVRKQRGEEAIKAVKQQYNREENTLAQGVSGGLPAGIEKKIEKPAFDPRGGHIRQLQAWEKQQAVKTGSQ